MTINSIPSLPFLDRGLIDYDGTYPNRQMVKIFGRAPDVDDVYVDAWEGPTTTYVFPAAAQQMQVVSTSASDTSAGTGVQKVTIQYLDANYAAQTEVVTLNGTTPVNTVATNIIRVNKMYASQTGTNGYPVGDISLKNTGATVTYSQMKANRNTAQQCIFTVPAGKTMYLSQWFAAAGSATGTHFTQVVLRSKAWDGYSVTGGGFLTVDPISLQSNSVVQPFIIPIKIPERTDIKVSATSDSSSANVIVTASIIGWYE